ncbi:molybdenum cofactor biosynthesis protein B [Pseudomonadota bacterium]
MPHTPANAKFKAINIAVLTVSDTRTEETDKSGRYLSTQLQEAGHTLAEKVILHDDIYQIRALISRWIAEDSTDAILITGGTGITGRDVTPEAVTPLFDKTIEGFGELFRTLSLEDIGASTIQSRAIAGQANGTFIFCMPGSTGACKLAWRNILKEQLDARTHPCNFINLIPRLKEV